MRRVPLGAAAEALFEGFKKTSPALLGDYTTLETYELFFLKTFRLAYREGSAWVVVATEDGDHAAEIHAYSFDKSFRNTKPFFQDVIRELTALRKWRLWTVLMPQAGHRVRQELISLGFEYEGLMRSYYYLGKEKGFANGELWARISVEAQEDRDGK